MNVPIPVGLRKKRPIALPRPPVRSKQWFASCGRAVARRSGGRAAAPPADASTPSTPPTARPRCQRRRPTGVKLEDGYRGGLLAALVLERDAEPDAIARDRSVLDRDIGAQDLRNTQVANALRGGLDRVARGGLPRLGACPDHFCHAIDAVCHLNLLRSLPSRPSPSGAGLSFRATNATSST